MAEVNVSEHARVVLDAMSPSWPGSTPEELATGCGLTSQGVVRIASSLVRRGLASREYRLGLVHYWRHEVTR